MQKTLKWLTLLVAAGVAVFVVFFLISINSNETSQTPAPLKHKSEVSLQKPKEIWLESFSKSENLGYFYPVNEVLVQVDLNEKIANNTIYKLSAALLDPYQLFCLQEELKRHGFEYYLKKDKDGTELLIYSKDHEKLDSLVKVLKNYRLTVEFNP